MKKNNHKKGVEKKESLVLKDLSNIISLVKNKSLDFLKKLKNSNNKNKSVNNVDVLNSVTINEYMDRPISEVLVSLDEDGKSYTNKDLKLVLNYEKKYENREEILSKVRSLMINKDRKFSVGKVGGFKRKITAFYLNSVKPKFDFFKNKVNISSKIKPFKLSTDDKKKAREERKAAIRKKLDISEIRKEREKKRKETIKQKKYKLKNYLSKAGIYVDAKTVSKKIFDISIVINFIISAYVIYYFSINYNYTIYYAIINMIILWTVIFAALLVLIWLAFHIILDLRIFQRKVSIEMVLPDFLQLTSANIRAGMPIDQSLWYAVRPRFGILAKEIEIVAKETMSGTDLKDALRAFTAKYDSNTLKRSFNLLIEGMDAGGEVGDLLNKISINISEANLLKKEMSANVTSYVIFISFATLVAAPFLFALSSQLLNILTTLTSTISVPSNSMISFSGAGITQLDFRIYSILSIVFTSTFSALIIAIIKKGHVKEGISTVPKFIAVSLGFYFLGLWVLENVFVGLI